MVLNEINMIKIGKILHSFLENAEMAEKRAIACPTEIEGLRSSDSTRHEGRW